MAWGVYFYPSYLYLCYLLKAKFRKQYFHSKRSYVISSDFPNNISYFLLYLSLKIFTTPTLMKISPPTYHFPPIHSNITRYNPLRNLSFSVDTIASFSIQRTTTLQLHENPFLRHKRNHPTIFCILSDVTRILIVKAAILLVRLSLTSEQFVLRLPSTLWTRSVLLSAIN